MSYSTMILHVPNSDMQTRLHSNEFLCLQGFVFEIRIELRRSGAVLREWHNAKQKRLSPLGFVWERELIISKYLVCACLFLLLYLNRLSVGQAISMKLDKI